MKHGKGELPATDAQKLGALRGWVWNAKRASWNERMNLLRNFVAREGHARVAQDHVEGGVGLGKWVNAQRHFFKTGKLADDRRVSLEDLPGWVWSASDARWDEAYALLEQFIEEHGHAMVPQSHRQQGFGLGSWVERQRSARRKGKLAEDRVRRLSSLSEWRCEPREGSSDRDES